MSILIQEREDILLNNNNAQSLFEEIIVNSDKSDNVLDVNTSLSGDLDLSLMNSDKYKHIDEITFSQGKSHPLYMYQTL